MPYNPSWTDKDIRQYRHIEESSGSKQIAAATVNKLKNKHKKKKRGR